MKTSSKLFECGGRKFSIGTLPAVEAIKVEVAVARVIGEPLFKAFTTGKTDGQEIDMEQAGALVIGLLASKLNADDLLTTLNTVFTYVTCDEQRVEINSTFTGRNRELWLVFIEALKFNFADFFPDGLLASLPGKRSKGLS